MDVRHLPAVPVARTPWHRRLVGALVVVLAASLAAPAMGEPEPDLRYGPLDLVAATAEVKSGGNGTYACFPPLLDGLSPEARPPVTECGLTVPVVGAQPGPAWLAGVYRDGVLYVVAQGPPRPEPVTAPPPRLTFCCPGATRYTRAEVQDALHEAKYAGYAPYLAVAPDGEPMVTFHVVAWTPAVSAFVAGQPDGLVQPRAWLRPV